MALDAHPLVREWFGDRLEQTSKIAWKAAHSRVYDHLRRTANEGREPTLESLAPLYQAIAHGCRAGRHQETLDKVYVARICRRRPDGLIEFYAAKKLGAMGADLAAISWFFHKPYEVPLATLVPGAQSWVLGTAAVDLRAQGRFSEALPAMRAALRMGEQAKDWQNCAIRAGNLCEAEQLVGEIDSAIVTAQMAVVHADRNGVENWRISRRATLATVLYAAGRRDEAERLFADAELRQRTHNPRYQQLFSLSGFWYCDLLLSKNDTMAALDRTAKNLALGKQEHSLLTEALNLLNLGRAYLALAIKGGVRDDANSARSKLEEAVDELRAAETGHHVPRGLLGRAVFRRAIGDWDGALRDIAEVEEVAEPGPMKLFLCDMALERTRLAFAKVEAFTPLSGLIDDSPPKPVVPHAAEAKSLIEEAAKQLIIAADYIETCGYHRRDEELAELQDVLHGTRKFADLPARV
jgi:hypothetical protein